MSNCLLNVIKLVKNHVHVTKQKLAVSEIAFRCTHISAVLYTAAQNNFKETDFDIKDRFIDEYIFNSIQSREILYDLGNAIEQVFSDNPKIMEVACIAWKAGIEAQKKPLMYYENKEKDEKEIASYVKKIERYDKTSALKIELNQELTELRAKANIKFNNHCSALWGTLTGIGTMFTIIFGGLALSDPFFRKDSTITTWLVISLLVLVFGAVKVINEYKSYKEMIAEAEIKIKEKESELANLEKTTTR